MLCPLGTAVLLLLIPQPMEQSHVKCLFWGSEHAGDSGRSLGQGESLNSRSDARSGN